MILRYCFLLMAWLWLSGLSAQIILSEKKPSQSIGKALFVLEDKEGQLDIDKVSTKEFEQKFKPSEQEVFNVGVSRSTYWLRFDVQTKNLAIKDWILYSSYSFLDEVRLYQKNTKGEWQSISLGIEHSFEKRPIKHRYIIFPISFNDTLPKRFWFFRHFSDYRKETKILFLKWSKFLNP